MTEGEAEATLREMVRDKQTWPIRREAIEMVLRTVGEYRRKEECVNEKGKRRDRRRTARKFKVACPCGRLGCETGRGSGGGVSASIRLRRDLRRGGLGD